MKKVLILFLLFPILIYAANYESKGYNLIQKYFEEGKISYQEQLLQKFYYIFDKNKLDPKFKFENDYPVKCATSLIIEYQRNKHLLDQKVINEIDAFLNPDKFMSPTAFTYDSPGGKFRLTYETTGPNAVPTADGNGNGVPDFVEWVASYFDYSWAFEIDTLGFLPPPIGTGKYQVSFEEMSAYGYTTVVSGTLTRIVMHRNFNGFPPNQDPEGNVKGAAKVTAAHEFKHAHQIVYNYWNEPSWYIELDATWMEDIAYDYVNDYYNYITSTGSPFTSPGQSLDAGDGYEDCNWMIFLGERFNVNINRQIWQRRQQAPGENMFATFNYVLSTFYSSNFQNAFREYIVWNFLTNSRATTTHPGYGEATSYPLAVLCTTVSSFPFNGNNCSITKYAANFIRINPLSNSNSLQINFNGANSPHVFKVTVVTRRTNGLVQSFEIPLDANNDGSFLIPIPNNQLSYAGLCVAVVSGNTGPTFTYSITEQTSFSTSVSLNSGWNLLSIPISLSNMSFSSIFPEATSNAYGYDNGYQVATNAELGKGYWLKFDQSLNKNLTGTPQSSIQVNVKAGWNMIGPLHNNIPVANVSSNPPNIIQSYFYGYNNGYQQATTLERGKGYWVKVSSNGTITIPSSFAKTEENLSDDLNNDISILNSSPKIIFETNDGQRATLYLTSNTLSKSSELPPVPPSQVFDVRFSDNTFCKSISEKIYYVDFQGSTNGLKIRLENISSSFKVYDALTEELIGQSKSGELNLTLKSQSKLRIEIQNVPVEFKLLQNYPNPFNPKTKIVFSLEKDGLTKLEVYNSLGEKIGVLADEVLSSGRVYEFEFDGSNLSSGIYLIKLSQGNSVQLKKMVLIK
ncbi:MAG: T9SS type A sorting domain-containing protein [Ignavibacteria bacterium]|nr:T9SS type A sorting domain-containing protein [Ignavibacteria bacterium]